VWALSSHTENFGIAVVEAMAAGSAVVITPGVNLAEDVRSAQAGIVADPVPQEFAAALLSLLTDDERRQRMRRAAPNFAANYDWSAVAPRLLELYRTAARGPVRGAP
jgi:glycosyltransferase involved in cell wall biosynthesis